MCSMESEERSAWTKELECALLAQLVWCQANLDLDQDLEPRPVEMLTVQQSHQYHCHCRRCANRKCCDLGWCCESWG
jgi:hypothetical protein